MMSILMQQHDQAGDHDFFHPWMVRLRIPIVLQFQFCMRTLYTSMSVNKISHHPLHKTCRFLGREREREMRTWIKSKTKLAATKE
jgi:hypothetical protein